MASVPFLSSQQAGSRQCLARLNQQPTVRVVIGPQLPVALVAQELDDFADVLEGQVERRLPKLLDELSGVRFVAPSPPVRNGL